jgi:hypothetical protein
VILVENTNRKYLQNTPNNFSRMRQSMQSFHAVAQQQTDNHVTRTNAIVAENAAKHGVLRQTVATSGKRIALMFFVLRVEADGGDLT